MPGARETIRTTCPRDCYDACGVLAVRRDGVLHQVRGDPEHPVSRGKLCRKCAIAYNGVLLDPAQRLLHPLRRAGRKGEGRFDPISWAQAIEEVAGRLGEVVERDGGAAVLNAHYTGTFAQLAYGFGLRFFNRIGATEVDPDTICNNAGHAALGYVYGTSTEGFDPRTARDAACILVWGANPSASAPHQHEHWLPDAPGAVVVVDPIATPTARAADLHLQPRPGTDAALAFVLLHVLQREGRLDRAFLAEHTIGWDEVEPLLELCTPAWGEERTGVPAAQIERAAALYGAGPSLLWIGQGLQRHAGGGNVVRAVSLLPAATGNLGRPGAGFLYLNGAESRGLDEDYVSGEHLRAGEPAAISHMDLAPALEDPGRFRALVCWNINLAASNPDQARVRAALEREDLFTVALDLFPTDTTDLADVVLPAASFLESHDLVASYFNRSLSAQVKASEPLGESLPNTEIFRRLAAAMGYDEPELSEPDAQVIAALLQRSGSGLDFEALAAAGTVAVPAEPAVQFDGLRFPTPSGKVELASDRAQADGLPRVPQPAAEPAPAGDRLRLLSPASPWMLNASFANDAKILRRAGAAVLALHPDDAAARGLAEGEQALLVSDVGRLSLPVTLSGDVPRGVALTPKGRWPKLEGQAANVNVLVPARKSDMGESTTVHGTEVTVSAAPAPGAVAR